MASYQKMIVTFLGTFIFLFVVSVQSSDVRSPENRIHTYKLPSRLPLLAAIPRWRQRVPLESREEEVNATEPVVYDTKPRFAVNSRKFQERKLDFDPDLDDENFLNNPEFAMPEDLYPENKVVMESTSDLIRSMYYMNLPAPVPKKTTSSVLDLLGPSASPTVYNFNKENHMAKTKNGNESSELLGSKIRSPASTSVSPVSGLALSTYQPKPTIKTSENGDTRKSGSINSERTRSSSFTNNSLHVSGPANNTLATVKSKVNRTKEVETGLQTPKYTYQLRLGLDTSSPSPIPAPFKPKSDFRKEESHLLDVNSRNVNYVINETTLDNNNVRNPSYSMATLTYPSRFQANDSIAYEKNKGQSQFPISSLHSDERLNIRALATASVIFIMALSALFAGAAPFWHGQFFQLPMHSPYPYEIPFPFDRHQFLNSSPPLMANPVQEQATRRAYYDSFPYYSGLRRKRSTLQN